MGRKVSAAAFAARGANVAWTPTSSSMDRRSFFAESSAIMLAGLAWPHPLAALARDTRDLDAADEDLWRIVRAAFPIPSDRIYLNVGTLGAQPEAVVDAVIEH